MFNQNQFAPPFPNFSSALKRPRFNWGNLLNNTQKTLGIINQAIPVFYQIKPIWNNAKTMFRVFGELNKMNKNGTTNTTSTTDNSDGNSQSLTNAPNFFV